MHRFEEKTFLNIIYSPVKLVCRTKINVLVIHNQYSISAAF